MDKQLSDISSKIHDIGKTLVSLEPKTDNQSDAISDCLEAFAGLEKTELHVLRVAFEN